MKEETVIHEIYQTTRYLSKVMNERLQSHGIFQSQWAILYCISEFGPMSQTEIRKYLNVEAPTVTRTVTKLEQNGWVFRQKGDDQREKIVVLTDKAKRELPSIRKAIQGFEHVLLAELSPKDRDLLVHLLKKVGGTLRTPTKDETNE